MELFFFGNPLYLSLFEHRKRTVTLYQNYGSSLALTVNFNTIKYAVHFDSTKSLAVKLFIINMFD